MIASLLGPLDYMFGEVLRLAVAAAFALAGATLAIGRSRGWGFETGTRRWMLVSSLTTIWIFTQHNPYQGSGRALDLNPFGDLQIAVNTTGRYRDIVVANVLLFVPLGLALAWNGARFVRAATVGAVVSILCEVVQYASNHGRVAQTGDVVVNVAGVIVGWAAFVALTGGWGPLTPGRRRSSSASPERAAV